MGNLGPIEVVFKLWDEDTGGTLAIVEHPFPVGALVPPHLHTREDRVLDRHEGEIGFRSRRPRGRARRGRLHHKAERRNYRRCGTRAPPLPA